MAGPASSIPAWLVVAVAVCVGLYAVLVVGLLLAGRRADARAVAGFVPDCVVLFKRLLADPWVAGRRKLALVLLLAYLVSPIDLIPDFIPILGQLDDAIVVVLVLRYVLRGADRDALRRLWPGPESSFEAVMAAAYGRSA
jgi:uncharacterized membrane protein YkvA (DUF1232 family)